MDLKALPSDAKVFIDTNVLLYAISDHPRYGTACNEFLDRVKAGEIKGKTSVIVLNELLHKLIIGEIAEKEDVKPTQVVRRIKKNKEILQDLKVYETIKDVEDNYNLEIASIRREDFVQARKSMKRHLLLSNDALHLAVMGREKIVNVATNDPDFESIKGIKAWKPHEFSEEEVSK